MQRSRPEAEAGNPNKNMSRTLSNLVSFLPGWGLLALGAWESADGISYFSIGALVIGLAIVCCVFLKKDHRQTVAVAVWSIAAGAVAADYYLLIKSRGPIEAYQAAMIAAWEEAGLEDYDPRGPLEVVRDLRARGIEAHPKINPATLLAPDEMGVAKSTVRVDGREVLPISTLSNALSVYCNELGQYLVYQSDVYGFHNPPDVWERGATDVVIVGDSYGEGSCVPSEANMAAHIRKRLAGTINLSMGGNGPLMQLASLAELPPRYNPKVVLWLHYAGNDLGDLGNESKSALLMGYLEDSFTQNLFANKAAIDRELAKLVDEKLSDQGQRTGMDMSEFGEASLLDFLMLTHLRARLAKAASILFGALNDAPLSLDLFETVIETAKDRINAKGAKMVFVFLPGRPGRGADGTSQMSIGHRDEVLEVIARHDIPVIDISSEWAARPNPRALFSANGRGHYNEEGYRAVATSILEVLCPNAAAGCVVHPR